MFGAWVEEEVEEQPGCLGVQRRVPSDPHLKAIPALQA